MIKQTVFNHNWFYVYKIHSEKIGKLPKSYGTLKFYLNDMLEKCPHDYFKSGPSGSKLKFKLENLKIHEIKGHEICDLTKQALNQEVKQKPHSKVQTYFIQNDKKTLAVEIPIWLKSNELNNFKDIFNSEIPLTGHIDLIRNEEGEIWVWDYKPNAEKEKFASTQVCLYALMLSKRTNIPLEKFKCGYFDEKSAFIFKPQNIEILQKVLK